MRGVICHNVHVRQNTFCTLTCSWLTCRSFKSFSRLLLITSSRGLLKTAWKPWRSKLVQQWRRKSMTYEQCKFKRWNPFITCIIKNNAVKGVWSCDHFPGCGSHPHWVKDRKAMSWLGVVPWQSHFTLVTFKHLIFALNCHYWPNFALISLHLHI